MRQAFSDIRQAAAAQRMIMRVHVRYHIECYEQTVRPYHELQLQHLDNDGSEHHGLVVEPLDVAAQVEFESKV
jgi:hypothetical protein